MKREKTNRSVSVSLQCRCIWLGERWIQQSFDFCYGAILDDETDRELGRAKNKSQFSFAALPKWRPLTMLCRPSVILLLNPDSRTRHVNICLCRMLLHVIGPGGFRISFVNPALQFVECFVRSVTLVTTRFTSCGQSITGTTDMVSSTQSLQM